MTIARRTAQRIVAAALCLSACSHETRVHDLTACETGSGDCEYGCRRGMLNPPDAGGCALVEPAPGAPAGETCSKTFYTDGADPNHHGCCQQDGDVLRFRECCERIATDGGVRYECPR